MIGNAAEVTGGAVGKTGCGIGWLTEMSGTPILRTPIARICGIAFTGGGALETSQNGDLIAGPVDLGSSGIFGTGT